MMRLNKFIILYILLSLIACNDNEQTGMPKPRTYPRVEFPKKEYTSFNSENCNFKFEYPKYAKVVQETNFFEGETPNDCWYNVVFPQFNGQLYLTYYSINSIKEFDKYIVNSFELTSAHNIKANGRKETLVKNEFNTSGLLFKVSGDVASHTQFFLTDTTKHFIRGALYFNNKVNLDSMRIIQEFIDKDVTHLLNTFQWTN